MKRGIGIFLVGCSIIVLYFVLATFGILPSYALVPRIFAGFVVFALFCTVLVTVLVLQHGFLSRALGRSKQLKKYSEPNPGLYRRVVRDGIDGVEKLVTGSETTTYRKGCLEAWQFETVDMKSTWLIKDDRGNDITESLLSTFDGIAVLIGDYGTESYRESLDRSVEYSDLQDSVEYFDD